MAKKYYVVKFNNQGKICANLKEFQDKMRIKNSVGKGFNDLEAAKKHLQKLMGEDINNKDYIINKTKPNGKPKKKNYPTAKKRLIAYTDGSYNSNKKEGAYGCVCLTKDNQENIILGKCDFIDKECECSVYCELTASIKAIEYAIDKGFKEIVIYHDFIGVSEYIDSPPKKFKNFIQKYCDFVKEAMKKINISFTKVKAHSGNYFNNWADKLAGFALNNKLVAQQII